MWGYIGWPEYAALSSMIGLSIVLINWAWISKLTPAGRFKELEPLLYSMDRGKSEWSRDKNDLGVDLAKMYELEDWLLKLGIEYPSSVFDLEDWSYFLSTILSYCRLGQLRETRKFSLRLIGYLENKKV